MKSNVWYWLIAFVVTLAAAVYQRETGPTYPAKVRFNIDGKLLKAKLPRSHESIADCPVELNIPDTAVSGELVFRHVPGEEAWTSVALKRQNDKLIASLPLQPPAGKLQYQLILRRCNQRIEMISEKPSVVIRFKGAVPAYIIIPHILIMFTAMLLSTLAAALALGKKPAYRTYTRITLYTLILGGLILGPIVQKYAFGQFWTGIPFGFDLTDNKTLIGFAFFLIAYIGNLKKERPYLTVIAAIILLLIFSIPHSLFGSQLNYSTGKVIHGCIMLNGLF